MPSSGLTEEGRESDGKGKRGRTVELALPVGTVTVETRSGTKSGKDLGRITLSSCPPTGSQPAESMQGRSGQGREGCN